MAFAFTPVDSGAMRTVNVRLTATLSAGDAVKLGTNGVAAGAAGDTVFGFLAKGGVSGDIVACYRGPGTFQGTAAAAVNFANGDRVYLAASGKLDTGAINNRSMGVVTETDPASAGTVFFDFDPWGTFAHA